MLCPNLVPFRCKLWPVACRKHTHTYIHTDFSVPWYTNILTFPYIQPHAYLPTTPTSPLPLYPQLMLCYQALRADKIIYNVFSDSFFGLWLSVFFSSFYAIYLQYLYVTKKVYRLLIWAPVCYSNYPPLYPIRIQLFVNCQHFHSLFINLKNIFQFISTKLAIFDFRTWTKTNTPSVPKILYGF